METRLKLAEKEKKDQEKRIRKERETTYQLKLQIDTMKQCETQRLFLNISGHNSNIYDIQHDERIKDDVKKVWHLFKSMNSKYFNSLLTGFIKSPESFENVP